MLVLGIESTAHTFGVGITDGKEIVANEKDTYKPKQGGIIPREAADHHYKFAPNIIKSALDKASVKLKDIDIFAFSQGPGIYSPLKVSFQISNFLSQKYKKKLIGVNHCIAHLEIARKETGFEDPVMLYVSGGNTQIITFAEGHYRVFGETQDIGVGNLLDKFGRVMGISFPAGPEIEKYASKGKRYIPLPYSIKGMDVSLSGIETFISNIKDKHSVEDLSFSLQETVFSMLIEASERALAYTEKESFVITGGVAANKRLNEMGRIMAESRGVKFKSIPMEYAGDNGAMIAYTGYLMKNEPEKDYLPKPVFRTDSVKINYR
ncbi:tRNA (adenosine(37)-N6)-threonylcarbamoyltransferase complex transferase subunit TsaD [Candidatus Parvarchaeota archaeon]|nr:tRNA (adenosine(37)-N6)-threonylcarbamoyltransferase complex transferase subunit TsaD [Candidatus Acidifodinimicrobium mancum]